MDRFRVYGALSRLIDAKHNDMSAQCERIRWEALTGSARVCCFSCSIFLFRASATLFGSSALFYPGVDLVDAFSLTARVRMRRNAVEIFGCTLQFVAVCAAETER